MSKQFARRGPKRVIRKHIVFEDIITQAATHDSIEMDESIDAETLIRMVGNIVVSKYSNVANNGYVNVCIMLAPAGTEVAATGAQGTSIDGRDAELTLWAGVVDLLQQYDTQIIPFDVKGMRKLKKGDKIFLDVYALVAQINVAIAATMFYKKA